VFGVLVSEGNETTFQTGEVCQEIGFLLERFSSIIGKMEFANIACLFIQYKLGNQNG